MWIATSFRPPMATTSPLSRSDAEGRDKAEQVGERVPHVYLGDPKYRLVTMVNFSRASSRSTGNDVQSSEIGWMPRTRSQKANTLAKHLTRNPRSDMFVVADFDGKPDSQFGIASTSSNSRPVFHFR